MRSKLLEMTLKNIGCVGNEGLKIDMDNIVCLVGGNNSGKSTVLCGYELVVGSITYSHEKHYCKRSKGENATIELSVHIPRGTTNIAEKWKVQVGENLIVRSRWEWDKNGNKTRKTYDPEIGEFSEDGNAAGLDTVFNSRLPIPFRIGALENSSGELKILLKLLLDPIADSLKTNLEDDESELGKALSNFSKFAQKPVEEYKEVIEKINDRISKSHNRIFPNLNIDLSIGMSELKIDAMDALSKGSKLKIREFGEEVDWDQQGTGSQRSLFWSILQVRSRLQAVKNFKIDTDKKIKQAEKELKKLDGELKLARTAATKALKEEAIKAKKTELEFLKNLNHEDAIDDVGRDIALPGYMLLIDEPEVALHPNAIRAASQYLYELSRDPNWQIIISTHSPLFVNPLENHTTIVRLSRCEGSPSPKSYRSDSISFSDEEFENLKMINSFDQNVSEMFFGQYLIIVEGDTEVAAFDYLMRENKDKYSLNNKPILIRARGKFSIIPLIKMLAHFKVHFSVLHDSDFPKNKNGNKNNVWTGNEEIYKAIVVARKAGLRVVHRLSMSTFEVAHGGIILDENGIWLTGTSKDKPWEMYQKVKSDKAIAKSVEAILDDLLSTDCPEEPFEKDFLVALPAEFKNWVGLSKIKDPRFTF